MCVCLRGEMVTDVADNDICHALDARERRFLNQLEVVVHCHVRMYVNTYIHTCMQVCTLDATWCRILKEIETGGKCRVYACIWMYACTFNPDRCRSQGESKSQLTAMYMCSSEYTYAQVHTYLNTRMHLCIHIATCTCMHTCACSEFASNIVCTWINATTHRHQHVRIPKCIHTCILNKKTRFMHICTFMPARKQGRSNRNKSETKF